MRSMGVPDAAPSDASVVRVLDRDRRPTGAGFLTGERDVVTCAHVVAAALGLAEDTVEQSPDRLWLDFPLAAPGRPVEARIVAWVPTRADRTGDIAVLRLLTAPPAGAPEARLVENGAAAELRVRTFGFPDGYDDGTFSTGVLRGRQATGWFQYDTDPTSQYEVKRGFSGAPVWDLDLGGVVGMVVGTDSHPDRRSAYLIPTETLCDTWPALRNAALARGPFRALNAFQENDAELFHGRDDAARRIVDRIAVGSGITLVGPSGSGKSSLLHAGVLPRLRAREDIAVAALRPGKAALEALALALLPLLEPGTTEVARLAAQPGLTLLLREGGMSAVVERTLAVQGKHRLLLIVDQFEEALVGSAEADLDAFAAALGRCLAPGSRLQVVLALRADFFTAALSHAGVAPLIDDSRVFPLSPMSADEVRAAVEGPLAGLAVRYEQGLVNRLLSDLGPDPTRLPLLQFTLTELWECQKITNGIISHAHYDSLGGVARTLANHAERVWSSLREEDRPHARSLLVQLVHPGGPDTSPTRRSVPRTDLTPEQWRVAQRLMTTRLLVPAEDHRSGDTPVESVELAHETLLVQWGRLRDFVSADAGFRSWQEDLRRRIGRWDTDGRDTGRLLRGSDLREARNWRGARPDELSPAERVFIDTSAAGARRRLLVVTAITAAVALIAATGTFVWRYEAETRSSTESRSTAADVLVQQSRDAQASTAQGGPYDALLLAMRAFRTRDTDGTRKLLAENYARYGFADLIAPFYPSDTGTASLTGIPTPSVSADGRVVVSRTATGEVVVWRLGRGPLPPQHTGRHDDITAVSPDGSLIAVTNSTQLTGNKPAGPGGPPVVLYDVGSRRVVRQLAPPAEGDPLPTLPTGVLDLPDLGTLPPDYPRTTQYAALAYDPTGKRIAAATGIFGSGGRLIVWNAASGRIEKILPGPDTSVSQLAFTADGQGLLAVGNDLSGGLIGGTLSSLLTTWDLTKPPAKGHVLFRLPWENSEELMDLSPDGGTLALVENSIDGTRSNVAVALYRMPGGEPIGRPRPWRGITSVAGVTVTDNGGRVVVYDIPGQILDTTQPPGSPVLELPGRWQRIDTFGLGGGTTVLMADLGLSLLVRADGGGDPLRRVPAATGSATPPPAGAPKEWMAALCRILGDPTLPTAVEQKMPPGSYRGPLC
ncbi:trypsin-like peptidase domain-containing protein [Streptomyces polygonati]|uniref:Trypsin-like peptidase domain-containing protein n=1 Tax=Streptomyces polygonati TaxID=1617087 RepID=A0ABV8HIG2_9ACTN